jgi:hypothetical protein
MKSIRTMCLAAVAATAIATGALAAAAMSDDKIPATGGDIQIHAIHHAALMLTHANHRILVDPAPAPGAQGGDPTAEYKACRRRTSSCSPTLTATTSTATS